MISFGGNWRNAAAAILLTAPAVYAQGTTESTTLKLKSLTVPALQRYQVEMPPQVSSVKNAIMTTSTVSTSITADITSDPLRRYDESDEVTFEDGIYRPTWDHLAGFRMKNDPLPAPPTEGLPVLSGVPDTVAKLHGTDIEVTGFMLPLDFDPEVGVKIFLLMRDRALCCFARAPRINEFIIVEMPEGKGARFLNDIPVRAQGRLEVGEIHDGDALVGLYKMRGNTVEPVTPLR